MKKIIINLFIVVFILLIFEVLAFIFFKREFYNIQNSTDFDFNSQSTYYKKVIKLKDMYNNSIFRENANFGKKHKILIFGCSFAFGSSLKPDENFGYKLAEKLNSVVYNRAFPGWGVQHMLMLLEDKHSLNNIDEADTVIYLYIEDHLNRLNSYYWGWSFYNVINQRYFLKKANNNTHILQEYMPRFVSLHFSYIEKLLHRFFDNYKNSLKFEDKNYQLMIAIFDKSYQILSKKYPNAKFVIIQYNTKNLDKYKNQLEKTGWHVISTQDFVKENLNSEEYHFRNDFHPTEKAWNVIVDEIDKNNVLYKK